VLWIPADVHTKHRPPGCLPFAYRASRCCEGRFEALLPRTVFRKPLQFIVMSVMVVIFLYLYGLSVTVLDGHGPHHHFSVMVIVIERMAYLSVFLSSMTVMTLICGGFLTAGVHLPFLDLQPFV
jgi:hypothetical protein